MSNPTGPVILIVLCPIVLWLSTIWVPQSGHVQPHNHRRQVTDHVEKNSMTSGRQITPPLSASFLSNFFSSEPRALSRVELLFYAFDTTWPNIDGKTAKESPKSVNKTEHEAACDELIQIRNQLDSKARDNGEKLFAFNMLASNRIGLSRPLPDTRPNKCPKYEHPHMSSKQSRQKVSIVICYYNEAPSALLRTIYSILARSEHELIEEILIIDDFSEHGYDLEHIRPHLRSSLVKLVRTNKREGLIRARQFGADLARGDILIFLDSHVEANIGWLEPLIETIEANQTTIACPMIDLINAETMAYTASPMVRGGLSWSLHFKWDSVPSEDLKTAEDFAKPIETPTMAGGLYAISREYFYRLGAYDLGMNLWGGENIEVSLRTWLCGGKIVILPCSRLGHIFRKRRPYGPDPGQPDSLLYNSHRTARVWLDNYISKFYGKQPDAASLDSGDVSERIELRKHLKCNDFDWYMDNVYPKLRTDLKTATATESSSNEDDDDEDEDEAAQQD